MKKLIQNISMSIALCFALASADAQYVTIPDFRFVNWLTWNFPGCMNGNQLDTTCSAVVNATYVDCSSYGFPPTPIYDLTGISYFDNLTNLFCTNNQLTSLPVLPPSLQQLECHHNNLTSLPNLSALTSLTLLACHNNQLTSLPFLPSSLSILVCSDNQLTSLPPLPSAMNGLYIFNNPNLKCLPPIGTVVNFEWDGTSIICLPNTINPSFAYPSIAGVPICGTPAQPGAITGNTSVCQGSLQAYSVAPVPNTSYYFWVLPSGWTLYSTTNSITATIGSTGGNISVRTFNTCANSGSAASTLAVSVTLLPTATITANGPTTFCSGNSVILNANTGTGLTYQWQMNGVNIPGAIASSYAANSTGSYTCVVNNGCSKTSNAISVTAQTTTQVITAFGSTTTCSGNAIMVTLNANTGAGLTYQWQSNNVNIPGAVSSSYTATTTGDYKCVVSNTCGAGNSNIITLTIDPNCLSGLKFDGINDRATIPFNSQYYLGSNNFTIEAWIKIDPVQSTANTVIISNRSSYAYGFMLFTSSGKLGFLAGGTYIPGPANNLLDNICHHIAITRSSGVISYYIDGVFSYSVSGYNQSLNNTHELWLGNDEVLPTVYLKGMIHEVRFWNLARTQTEIAASKNTYLSGTESGLIGYWKMNEGNGQTINDYSTLNNSGYLGASTATDIKDPIFATGCSVCSVTTITAPTSISVSGGSAKVCPGDTRTYTTPLVSGVIYNWTVPTGAVINSGQGTRTINVTYNSGFTSNGLISVVKKQGCGVSAPKTINVNRNIPATPSAITGLTYGLCAATNKTYSVTQVAGMTYQWTVPAVANIVNGQGTNAITINFPSTNFTGTVSVNAMNACDAGNARNLTVRAVPSTPVSITGPNSACANQQNVAYSTAAVATATSYTWGVPSGALITSGQGTNSIVMKYGTAGGNVKVRATNACGNSSYRNLAVTINCREGFDDENGFDVLIYPNPSKSYFTINVLTPTLKGALFEKSENSYSLIVKDVIGRIIYQQRNLPTNESYDFGIDLSGGLYFAEIMQGYERKIVRMIKSN